MTKEEFLVKNEWYCEEKFTEIMGNIKVTKVYFHNGDTVKKGDKIFDFDSSKRKDAPFTADASGQIQYCFKSVPVEMDSNEIFAIIEDKKISRLWDEKSAEYEKLVEEHRKTGDLIEWWLKERDESIDIHNLIYGLVNEDEQIEYKNAVGPHIDILIDEHKEKGDFIDWVFDCKKKDNGRYQEICGREKGRTLLREKYEKEISEHRVKGDLFNYLWEKVEEGLIELIDFAYHPNSYNKFIGYTIITALTKKEKKDGELFFYYCVHNNEEGRCQHNFYEECYYGFKYLYKLSQKPKDSYKYQLFEKFLSSIKIQEHRDKVKENIKKTKLEKSLIKYGSIAGAALILILISSLCIHRAITKDARLAKKEAQRIEKIKIGNAKNVAKNQANDLAQLEKLGSAKLNIQDLLVSTAEPAIYVIAPMTYDTKKFVEANSHDKTLFGVKDNSVERLTVLESCLVDFQNSTDNKTGVSFLDRSKIAQIEKEHKFQLGDWSNDKKTAEVGRALNANILLFFDKFGFIDNGSGEYRFEAKFVDINTMQSTSYNVVYQNAKKKVVTPGVVQTISFRDFTPVSTKKYPFAEELKLKTLKCFRTVQKSDLKQVSPLGQVTKVELSKFDTKAPSTDLLNVSSIYFDGFDLVEFKYADKTESLPYTFDAVEMNLERIGNLLFTDGKIGTLTVKTDAGYKKYDVFTENDREYYIHVGYANLEKATVNYYLELAKQ